MRYHRCIGCSRRLERFDPPYAYIYCSERCWYDDGCMNKSHVMQIILLRTFRRLGVNDVAE